MDFLNIRTRKLLPGTFDELNFQISVKLLMQVGFSTKCSRFKCHCSSQAETFTNNSRVGSWEDYESAWVHTNTVSFHYSLIPSTSMLSSSAMYGRETADETKNKSVESCLNRIFPELIGRTGITTLCFLDRRESGIFSTLGNLDSLYITPQVDQQL